ncbi:MAG: hypothetical protein QOD40_316 [Alphaproteobacteria bacterium]|jgi:hypothetical protein|nr:hypothetical protein [Alphaproteobacteria bacterium]
MWSAFLIVHMLVAVALIGAITHQAFSICWPNRDRSKSFVASFRGVNGMTYTNAIIILFILTVVLGSIIYPYYRLNVRTVLERLRLFAANGSFEIKEHLISIGLGLLPAYWYFWRQPLGDDNRTTRAILTMMLAFIVWWGFMVGHVLNNIRGFGS